MAVFEGSACDLRQAIWEYGRGKGKGKGERGKGGLLTSGRMTVARTGQELLLQFVYQTAMFRCILERTFHSSYCTTLHY